MCKMYEVVTGRKTKGNKDKLEGMLKTAIDSRKTAVIMSIPVDMLEIDTSYQTEARTERSLDYLVKNWDDNKCLPLSGVPHWEEGKIYLFDGYGRWIASQLLTKPNKPKKELDVMVILNAPKEVNERRIYEAKMYAFQNKNVAKMTPLQKHGAMLLMHDKPTETLEAMKNKYGFEYRADKGNRETGVLGSYTENLSLCKIDNGACADYVYSIIRDSGFDRKANGYVAYVIRALRDIYNIYANNRAETKQMLSEEFRKIMPINLKANALTKYPVLDFRTAVSLYVEDMVVENLGLEQSRKVEGTKIVPINKAKTA